MCSRELRSFKSLGVEWIGLELNNTCNIRCTFCPVTFPELQRPKQERILDKEVIFKVLEEIKEDGTLQNVTLNDYGEPFMYPYLEDVFRFCKENRLRMRFATNGTYFNDKNIELLRKYQPEEMVISVQCFQKESYQKVKGTKIDYDSWLDQIANFLKTHKEEDLDINVQVAIASNSHNSLRNRVLGLRLGDTNLPYPDKKFYQELNLFIESFCVDRMNIDFKEKEINKKKYSMYTRYYQITPKIGFEIKGFEDSTHYYNFKEAKYVDCYLPYLIINSQGKLLMCCTDYIAGTSLGNIKEKSIKEILVENYDVFINKYYCKGRIELCRKCKGEGTYRGLFLGQIINILRNIKRELNKEKTH